MSRQVIVLLLLMVAATSVLAHDVDNPGVKVRVVGYDPGTNTYNISCQIPPSTPGSAVDPRRFYAIDPIPDGANRSYYSTSSTFLWTLNPTTYRELVHRKAMYHMYCEVQNYSAPAGEQNIASEVHVDLRTTDNNDLPTVYVLSSDGPRVTLKCDPPRGTRVFDNSWSIRNRASTTSLPALNNQRIVNITLPEVGSGWDILCSVFDRETGKSTKWDMPLEVFDHGPAYVPTVEGCFPNEPCYISPTGIPPNSTLQLTITPAGAAVYINEAFKGNTDADGNIRIANIVPGVYNLAARKEGYDNLSTLVALPAGKTVTQSFTLQVPIARDPYNMCHSNIFSLPASCAGGSITSDTGTSCRTIVCSSGSNSLQVQACSKPDGGPTHFEMYKQAQAGTGVRICLGNTCIQNEGMVSSPNYPICLGNGSSGPQNISATWSPSQSTLTATAPATQTFSYALSNPSGLSTSQNWTVNGTPVTGTTSYTFSGDAGTYAIAVQITSPQNTLTHAWTLSVQDATNASNTSNACYTSVQSIPASCVGGALTTDSWNGCRKLICSADSSSLQILACDKTGYFEMYKQIVAGTAVKKICIGDTCISDNGYAKSTNYPICTGTTSAPPNTSTNTTNTTAATGLALSIAPWFPQGRNYVFKCTPTGYTPASYAWVFGDGHTQTTTSSDVYHTYTNAGSYALACTAGDKTATLHVDVA